AIARALAIGPDAIIADEPTSALDVSVRAQILNLLTDLKRDLGLAMVFISHDIQTVRYISDEIMVMNGGKVVEHGPAKDIFEKPQDDYTKLLLGAAPSLLHPKLGQ
ncbi:MAG: ABC transporter ATP-binding protein, partial [Atopobium minutum]|nr:ABC transporter ATP-binding protein [Atopobium minutum]